MEGRGFMDYTNYYMNLSLDLAGSRTKNRFRVELLWGISKLIDAHKMYEDYTVVFDFKCDIELHYPNGLDFYQIKTKDKGNYSHKTLTSIPKTSNSVLGKLYALYSPNQKVKLAIVCNKPLKIGNTEDIRQEICIGELNTKIVDEIVDKLKKELSLTEVNLENTFYICDGMDLFNPQHAILGKLVESFQEIKNEEPNNPNALYRLVSEEAQKKASYEMEITDYSDVLSLKGISKKAFDKMLESHRKKSITGIEQTKDFIKTLPTKERRTYNKALTDLLENDHSHDLNVLRSSIFEFIESNEDRLANEEAVISVLSPVFDKEFPVEFSTIMKKVFYLIVFYIYVEGGEV